MEKCISPEGFIQRHLRGHFLCSAYVDSKVTKIVNIQEMQTHKVLNPRAEVCGGEVNVDIAAIEIFRDKASSMSSPVLLASDTAGNRSTFKSIDKRTVTPRQFCDIVLDIDKDIPLLVELLNVKLSMLGPLQLRNATTATCAALCLRNQGRGLSDNAIRAGLETTFLLGEKLGFPGVSLLLEGAHTKESASSLVNTIEMVFPKRRTILVIAMANDKDYLGFATELLKAKYLDAVFLTEVSIAGDKSITTSASSLRKCWMQAASKQRIGDHVVEDFLERKQCHPDDESAILFAEGSIPGLFESGISFNK